MVQPVFCIVDTGSCLSENQTYTSLVTGHGPDWTEGFLGLYRPKYVFTKLEADLLDQTWTMDIYSKLTVYTSRFPCCVLLALSWNTANKNPNTDKLSKAIN